MNEEQVNSVKYSVESILMSSEFTNIEKDMIPAILKKNELYTLEETRELLEIEKERVIG
ncbi:hypothetical protein [uncultured Granulicatella sp.]|uniref:hypothetical protein n=1 Tax=uncultured Granulicatella sp. TaxID=316089 RepID=UPI0028EC1B44|nr:hypothetical protein [uncultured Granulicatella sp.]